MEVKSAMFKVEIFYCKMTKEKFSEDYNINIVQLLGPFYTG